MLSSERCSAPASGCIHGGRWLLYSSEEKERELSARSKLHEIARLLHGPLFQTFRFTKGIHD